MNKITKKIIILFLLLCFSSSIFAYKVSKNVVVEARTKVKNISTIIGKEINYEITILSRDGISYEFRDISFDNTEDISRILLASTNNSKEAKLNKTVINYKIAFYDIGQFVILPYQLSYNYMGSNYTIEGENLSIVVYPFSDGDTLPNTKKIFSLPIPFYVWIIIPCFILLVMLIIFFIKLIRKNILYKRGLLNRAEDVLALKELSMLEKMDYLKNALYSKYYFELTRILKVYISKRFLIDITGMTTIEIKKIVKENTIANRDEIFNLLDYADRIKFTKDIPEDSDIKMHTAFIKEYIKNNRNREIVLKEEKKNNK